jgi:hypothetical protein
LESILGLLKIFKFGLRKKAGEKYRKQLSVEDAQEIALRNQVNSLSREFNAGEKTADVFVTDLIRKHARCCADAL